MVRMLNFFCVALAGLACLALYHISEQTRVARVELSSVERQITGEHAAMKLCANNSCTVRPSQGPMPTTTDRSASGG